MKKSDVAKGAMIFALPFAVAEAVKAADVNDANNWGYLQIDVRLESKGLNRSVYIVKDDLCYPGALDGIDQYDTEETIFLPNRSGGFSDVENKKIIDDTRQNSSRTAVHIKGYYKGTIKAGSEPNIIVELSWDSPEHNVGRFGDMPLIATKEDADGNNIEVNGYRGDIRAEMDYSGPDFASIDFGKIPAGDYTENGPYFLHLRVDFEKLIADLDSTQNPSGVNLKDYAIGAKYYGQEGRSIADISGPNDIPDMIVDMYDLAKIAEQWLMRVEDGHIVSKAGLTEKVEKSIRPILMARQYGNSEQAQELFYGKEKAAELRQEVSDKRRIQTARNYIKDLDLSLLGTEEQSTLKQMLALSQNNHNGHLPKYETIDNKVPNNHRALQASQNGFT